MGFHAEKSYIPSTNLLIIHNNINLIIRMRLEAKGFADFLCCL